MVTTTETPLTFTAEQIWLRHQLDPAAVDYNVCLALRLRGALDPDALEAALSGLVERHEALRTAYPSVEGRPSPTVLPAAPVRLDHHRAADEDEVRRLAAAEAQRPFDLAAGPVLRARLARLAPADHVLLLTVHHIAVDEWSLGLLLSELDLRYRAHRAGERPELPPPRYRHAELAAAQRGADRSAALEHWRQALAGLPALDLPTDRPPAAEPSAAGTVLRFEIPPELTRALLAAARAGKATPYMAGLAAFTGFLARYCGQPDVAVGSTVANRALPGSEEVVGAFFNAVVMRGDASGDPDFRTLLARTRAFCTSTLTHQHLPYSLLSAGRAPLFRVLYEMHAGTVRGAALGDLEVTEFAFPDTAAKYDLALSLMPDGDRLTGHLTYRTELYRPGTAERLVESFLHVLGQLTADPALPLSEVELVPPPRQPELVAASRGPAPLGSLDQRMHDLFTAQVRRTPDALALTDGPTRLSYRELDELTNRIAHWLRGRGVGPESVVGVRLERSHWLVAAFLGIWKAGGAYLPLDPSLPAERLAYMASDSGAELVIDDPDELAAAVAELPSHDPEVATPPGQLAYIIYTSGSTGRPKGVLVEHRGLVNFLHWCVSAYAGGGSGGAPLFSSVAYDMVVPNIYTPLAVGQTLHILPADLPLDELGAALTRAPYGFIKLTPGQLEVLAGQLTPEQAARLAGVMVVGADAFPSRALAFWQDLEPAPVLLNEYGPTEASVANCVHTVSGPVGGELVPIGRPIAGTTLYVLDAAMRLVPAGVPGELYIGGDCVVRGYRGRAALTAERFVPDPFGPPGSRLYRTGDVGRLRADGEFEFLGRTDDQVKIRGFRVEPGEVAATLDGLPGVRQSVVTAAPGPAGTPRLTAYVVGDLSPAELRTALRRLLPAHMVPETFVPLDAIPLNPNGKVDRSALPPPDAAVPSEQHRPLTAAERRLAGPVAATLGVTSAAVDPEADLFTSGLTSLTAVQLMDRLRRELGVRGGLRAFFADPTLRGLAALPIGADGPTEADSAADEAGRAAAPVLLRLTPAGASPPGAPVYCFHPLGGSALCYSVLAARLESRRPVHGLQALGSAGGGGPLPELAARYATEVARSAGESAWPYTLTGWSAGGVLAFETARALYARGHRPGRVVLIDSVLPESLDTGLAAGAEELSELLREILPLSPDAAERTLLKRNIGFFEQLGVTAEQVAAYYRLYGAGLLRLWRDNSLALGAYRADRYPGPVTLLVSDEHPEAVRTAQESGWRHWATDLTVRTVHGGHAELLTPSHVDQLVPHLE